MKNSDAAAVIPTEDSDTLFFLYFLFTPSRIDLHPRLVTDTRVDPHSVLPPSARIAYNP